MIRRFVFLVVVALLPAWLVLKEVFDDAVKAWKADTRHDPELTLVFWRRVLNFDPDGKRREDDGDGPTEA